MSFIVKSPETEQEWRGYYQLRWEILRAPWQQPPGSERDELEDQAFHLMVTDSNQRLVGVGRLHRISANTAQIRYMAVRNEVRGKGIGGQLLTGLENKARVWGCQEIILNARETGLQFYLQHAYEIIGEAPTLFGSIAHKKMRKRLNQFKR